MAEIVLTGLSKTYTGGVTAVDQLDLTIADGEFFALLGPSGCGKTTLLRTIAGLEAATAGTIHIGDTDVTRLAPGQREVAMVFQDYALFPHMSVEDNIAYPLRVRRVRKADRHAVAHDAADQLGLGGLAARRPAELSGGQQQRVALARAIAAPPKVFLFDEPLSNLDARLRLDARSFLKRLQQELGVTTVFVTHDQAEALALADRMAVMDNGRIRQLGSPRAVFARPANTFVANFIGSTPMNLLDGVVGSDRVEINGQALPLPAEASGAVTAGQPVIVGLRPEYAQLSTTPVDGALRGTVAIVEHLGTTSLITVEADGFTVAAVVDEDDEPLIGTDAWVAPMPGRLLLYRSQDGELVESTRETVPAT